MGLSKDLNPSTGLGRATLYFLGNTVVAPATNLGANLRNWAEN